MAICQYWRFSLGIRNGLVQRSSLTLFAVTRRHLLVSSILGLAKYETEPSFVCVYPQLRARCCFMNK